MSRAAGTPVSKTPPRRERAALPSWAVLCFFSSGAAGLLYEVVWTKRLSLTLGNSLHAASAVVAAFLCGLALGAWWLGGRLSKRGDGARRYAALELGIGALGLCSLPLLAALDPFVGVCYRALGGGSTAFGVARFAIVFVALLPPALLMGATLPVLVNRLERGLLGPALARLYALNTAGAVVGALLAGFVLVPNLGLFATSVAAAALNLLAAGLAYRAGAATVAADARVTESAPEVLPESAVLPAAARRAVVIGLALSGFAALVFQIAWFRLFGLVLGSSVHSFAGVLGVYLAGLAIGAALAGRRASARVSIATFALLQAGVALSAALALFAFARLPGAYLVLARGAGPHWGALVSSQLLLVALVELLPCILLGAIFPVAARLLQTGAGGEAVGRAYALNTLGTIAGSLAAGYLLVPRLGPQGAHVVALVVSGAVALLAAGTALALRRGGPAPRVALVALAGALLAPALAALAPAWDPALMSAGLFRPSARAYVAQVGGGVDENAVRAAMHNETVLFYREGLNGSVLVTREEHRHNTIMRIGGKVDASDHDMLTQVLSGLLPGATADSGGRALVIGQGSGMTLASILATGVRHADLAELEPAVLVGSRFFHTGTADPLDDPRTRVIVEDGRTVLAHGRDHYDIIVSEPSNPWLAGCNDLFTTDFYRLVRTRLARGGVFTQWVQLYELSPEAIGSILGGFLAAFPYGEAYLGAGGIDLLLVAHDEPRALSLARLSTPAARAMLGRAELLGPEAVAAFWIAPLDSLRRFAAGAPRNTDDRPYVEYRAPRDLVEVGAGGNGGMSSLVARLPFGRWRDTGGVFANWSRDAWFSSRVRQLARSGRFEAARFATADARAEADPSADAMASAVTAEQGGQELGQLLPRARAASLAGRFDEASTLLAQAASVAPGNGRVWVLLAEQQRQLGDVDGALASVARALTVGTSGEKSDAQVCAGLVEIGRHRLPEAVARFAEAVRFAPAAEMPAVFLVRARLDAGDTAGARRDFAAARRVLPGSEKLAAMEREVLR